MNERTPLSVRLLLVLALLLCAFLLGFLLNWRSPFTEEVAENPSPPPLNVSYLQNEVSSLRQLPLKAEIACEFLDKSALEQELKASLEDELFQEDTLSTEKVLKFLGILKYEDNLSQVLLDVLSEQVYGFYDQESGQLKVLKKGEKTTALERLALVHEIAHGIQDQNFDLSRFLPPEFKGDDDELLAVQSLYEGDASWTSMLFVQNNQSLGFGLGLLFDSLNLEQNQLEKAPVYVQESLVFPYQEGMNFVKSLYERGGWTMINQAFEKPPQSSEQIIHPEKYLMNEQPASVSLPDWKSLQGWSLVRENTLGEFDFRFLFKSVVPESQALVASSGWNGSRYQLWEKDGKSVFVLESVWDTTKDASEASFTLEEFLKNRFGSAPSNYYRGSLYSGEKEAGMLYPSGQSVTMVIAPDEQLVISLLQEMP